MNHLQKLILLVLTTLLLISCSNPPFNNPYDTQSEEFRSDTIDLVSEGTWYWQMFETGNSFYYLNDFTDDSTFLYFEEQIPFSNIVGFDIVAHLLNDKKLGEFKMIEIEYVSNAPMQLALWAHNDGNNFEYDYKALLPESTNKRIVKIERSSLTKDYGPEQATPSQTHNIVLTPANEQTLPLNTQKIYTIKIYAFHIYY